jgi:hypothetical protein
MNRDSAAAEKEPCSAAVRKYVSCWSVIGVTFRCCSQSSIQRWLRRSDNQSMITLAAIALPLAVALGVKFGPEDRPGFNERRPLS